MTAGHEHDLAQEARRLLGRLDKRGDLERARAVGAWQTVAGPDVARHAAGYGMRGSELVVFVDSAVWAAELSALSEQYRMAVNAELGRETVGSIRFTVTRHARTRLDRQVEDSPEGEGPRPARIEPVPLAREERARLSAMAEAIHDGGLREAALGAAERHLEWQKGLKASNASHAANERFPGPESEPEH